MTRKCILVSWIVTLFLFGCSKDEIEIKTPVYETDFINIINEYTFDYTDDPYYKPTNYLNQCDSAYYSWLTTFDNSAVPAKEIVLNMQGEEIAAINQEFKERYDLAYIKNSKKSIPLFLFDSYFHCFDNICSLIVKDGLLSSGEHIQYRVYNLDTKDGKLLTNDELIEVLGADRNLMEEKLQSEIEDLGLVQCTDPFDTRACLYDNDNLPENVRYNYVAEINNESLLLLNDKGKLELLFSINNAKELDAKPYNGNNVSYLYPLQLVD